jgi:hypothetical protein
LNITGWPVLARGDPGRCDGGGGWRRAPARRRGWSASSTHGQVERRELLDPGDRLVAVPPLVGVHRDADVRTDRLPGDAQPSDVLLDVRADLELIWSKPSATASLLSRASLSSE